jgi:hypothetical protein
VSAGLLSVVIFPPIALTLLRSANGTGAARQPRQSSPASRPRSTASSRVSAPSLR